MTEVEAAKVVAILSASFPDSKWGEATCRAYESALADLDFELASDAVRRIVATSKFRPSISEIREAAAVVAVGERRAGADAWGDVVKAVRYVGSYGAPKFDDPLTARAVEALGWRNLCLGDSSEASDRARFCEVYDALSASERRSLVSEPGRLNDAPRGILGAGRGMAALPGGRAS